jgi:hypothetical protein
MTRTYQKWTVEDEEKLNNCNDFPKIASELERTVDAVQCRFTKIYIYPVIQELFYKDGELNVESLKQNIDTIVNIYYVWHKIEKKDIIRFLTYFDKKIRRALKMSFEKPEELLDYDDSAYSEIDDSEISDESDSEDSNDSDLDDSEGSEDSEDSDTDNSIDTDASDNSASDDSDDDNFTERMSSADKWKLKYYKLKHLNRIKIIDGLLSNKK